MLHSRSHDEILWEWGQRLGLQRVVVDAFGDGGHCEGAGGILKIVCD